MTLAFVPPVELGLVLMAADVVSKLLYSKINPIEIRYLIIFLFTETVKLTWNLNSFNASLPQQWNNSLRLDFPLGSGNEKVGNVSKLKS